MDLFRLGFTKRKTTASTGAEVVEAAAARELCCERAQRAQKKLGTESAFLAGDGLVLKQKSEGFGVDTSFPAK